MRNMPSHQVKESKTARSPPLTPNTHFTVDVNWNGLRRSVPPHRKHGLHLGSIMSANVASTPDSIKNYDNAAQLAPLFLSHIVQLHGLPETIVSDRDPKFTSLFWTEMHRLLGIKLARSTAFHPQSNGASERMIHKVSQVLRAAVRPDQLDWLTPSQWWNLP